MLSETSNNVDSSNDLQGLVIGPETSRVAEARRFRAVWAGGTILLQIQKLVLEYINNPPSLPKPHRQMLT